jgi:hypothetical protein
VADPDTQVPVTGADKDHELLSNLSVAGTSPASAVNNPGLDLHPAVNDSLHDSQSHVDEQPVDEQPVDEQPATINPHDHSRPLIDPAVVDDSYAMLKARHLPSRNIETTSFESKGAEDIHSMAGIASKGISDKKTFADLSPLSSDDHPTPAFMPSTVDWSLPQGEPDFSTPNPFPVNSTALKRPALAKVDTNRRRSSRHQDNNEESEFDKLAKSLPSSGMWLVDAVAYLRASFRKCSYSEELIQEFLTFEKSLSYRQSRVRRHSIHLCGY